MNDNAHIRLARIPGVEYIEDEIYLFDDLSSIVPYRYPYKSDVTIACICTAGELKASVNQIGVTLCAPGLLVMLPGQIRELEYISPDFECKFILMTKTFIDRMYLNENLTTYMSISQTPCLPLNEASMEAIINYYNMIKTVLRNHDDGFNRKAVVNHLTIAFFYGLGFYLHKSSPAVKSRNETIMEEFIKLVTKHCRTQHSISFYADRLCITNKYLSVIVKAASGKTAGEWINNNIILEAKYLLKSSTLTIQQISDELNFPSQSFFGKFFKREVGMTPKQYRDCPC